jgi:hypothetical protein
MAPALAQVRTCSACRLWTTAYLAFISLKGELGLQQLAASAVASAAQYDALHTLRDFVAVRL